MAKRNDVLPGKPRDRSRRAESLLRQFEAARDHLVRRLDETAETHVSEPPPDARVSPRKR